MAKASEERIKKLKQIYADAISLRADGDVTSELIQDRFGLSPYGASCILFMLNKDEFCPELEAVYTQGEMESLQGQDETTDRTIKFIEDIAPYQRHQTFDKEIAESDKETYVRLGFAKRMSFEDRRQEMIMLYVAMSRVLHQHKMDMLEALAHRDVGFFQDFFHDTSKEDIEKHLKKYGFNKKDTRLVLDLMEL
jgi:hypothetical protein